MKQEEIIRAWKDEDYRSSLNETQLRALPEHPSGLIELSGEEMATVGGQTTSVVPAMIYVSALLCWPSAACIVSIENYTCW
jgi:mersacidin/lichenicidin family type 2 lantibiotic